MLKVASMPWLKPVMDNEMYLEGSVVLDSKFVPIASPLNILKKKSKTPDLLADTNAHLS